MANKYKVEIGRTQNFIVDVLAENEEEAREKATKRFAEIKEAGIEHYHEDGDVFEEVRTVYDVSGTDDPFNP